MRILVIMDPVEVLDLEKDTSVGFILSSFRRGWRVSICTIQDLFTVHEQVWAHCRSVLPSSDSVLTIEQAFTTSLSEFEAVLMRKDPPVDVAYLHATHLLDLAAKQTFVSNHPTGVRFANEKAYALQFPNLTPRTRLSSNGDQIRTWLESSAEPLIVKPIDGHGGHGVFLLSKDDKNSASILEMLTGQNSRFVVVQTYLPSSRIGDKRVILINGEPCGAILRVPRGNDNRGNIHVGGRVVATELTERDLQICNTVGPRLIQDGLHFVGLDIIGDYLTEINVTSPTGIREYRELTGVDLADKYLDFIAAAQSE